MFMQRKWGLKGWVWFFLLGAGSYPAMAQSGNFFIRNFAPAQYRTPMNLSSPQNWDILQDHRGVVYIVNTSVLLEFDGVRFRNVAGTENFIGVRNLARDAAGRIYFGGDAPHLGYLAPDSAGQQQVVLLSEKIPEKDRPASILKTIATTEAIAFVAKSAIYLYRADTFAIFPAQETIEDAFNVHGRLLISVSGKGLFHFTEGKLEPLPFNAQIAQSHILAVLPSDTFRGKNNWLICTEDAGLFRVTENTARPLATSFDYEFKNGGLLSAIKTSQNTFAIGTRISGIVILDAEGRILQHINRSQGLIDDQVNGLYQDDQGGLWGALGQGLTRMEYPSAIRFYNYTNRLEGIVISVLKKGDHLYVGTTYGFFHLDLRKPGDFTRYNEMVQT
jgi:hypothetical protein